MLFELLIHLTSGLESKYIRFSISSKQVSGYPGVYFPENLEVVRILFGTNVMATTIHSALCKMFIGVVELKD